MANLDRFTFIPLDSRSIAGLSVDAVQANASVTLSYARVLRVFYGKIAFIKKSFRYHLTLLNDVPITRFTPTGRVMGMGVIEHLFSGLIWLVFLSANVLCRRFDILHC